METIDKSSKENNVKQELFTNLKNGETCIYDQLKLMIDGIHICLQESSLQLTNDEKQHLEYIEDQLIKGRFEILKAINQTKTLSYISDHPEKNQYFQK